MTSLIEFSLELVARALEFYRDVTVLFLQYAMVSYVPWIVSAVGWAIVLCLVVWWWIEVRHIPRDPVTPDVAAKRALTHTLFAPGLSLWNSKTPLYDVDDVPRESDTVGCERLPLFKRVTVVEPVRRLWALNVGERGDAELYADAVVQSVLTLPRGEKLVLLGASRGGATVFNALIILAARPDWTTMIRPRLAFAILFGPPATVGSVVTYRYGQALGMVVQGLMGALAAHDVQERWSMLARADLFAKTVNLPLAIVGSRADTKVPWKESTQMITTLLHDAGALTVEPLVLERAGHDFFDAKGEDRVRLVAYISQLYTDYA